MLRFAAEGTVQRVFGIAARKLRHNNPCLTSPHGLENSASPAALKNRPFHIMGNMHP
jgi:hypothetical protein